MAMQKEVLAALLFRLLFSKYSTTSIALLGKRNPLTEAVHHVAIFIKQLAWSFFVFIMLPAQIGTKPSYRGSTPCRYFYKIAGMVFFRFYYAPSIIKTKKPPLVVGDRGVFRCSVCACCLERWRCHVCQGCCVVICSFLQCRHLCLIAYACLAFIRCDSISRSWILEDLSRRC